ncbi:MAG: hypothetical protein IT323_05270 [Anaerolineae bacterium]|nr:hypothetical protein [Anaerolineae bacterium]
MDLDDLTRLSELDPDGMAAHIGALPEHVAAGWALGATLPLPDALKRLSRIVIAGANEGALAGELLTALAAETCNVPILVCRGYDLPAFADGQSTLIILVDHDGAQEQVLSALEMADARGAKILAVTAGGRLAAYAARSGAAVWQYTFGGPARAAFGWHIGLLLAFMQRTGLLRDLGPDVDEALSVARAAAARFGPQSPAVNNPAKRLAGQMLGRIPLIYGAGLMAVVARRWRAQINLNAKAPAFADELPEMDHNTMSGLALLPDGLRLAVVYLAAPHFDHPRIALRQDLTRQVFMMEGCVPDTVTAEGESALAQALFSTVYGDFTSFYLALAYGVDPTPTPATDEITDKLSAAR